MRQKINVGKFVDKGRELWEKHGDAINQRYDRLHQGIS